MDRQAPIFARIPPPVWALGYCLAAWAIGALAEPFYLAALHRPLMGWVLIGGGVALAASGIAAFSRAGTETMPASETNAHLVTSGPYRFTRNPMYLGLVLVTLGIAFTTGALLFLVVPLLVFLTNNRVTIPYEEAKMERQYGEAFRLYKQTVRRWI